MAVQLRCEDVCKAFGNHLLADVYCHLIPDNSARRVANVVMQLVHNDRFQTIEHRGVRPQGQDDVPADAAERGKPL